MMAASNEGDEAIQKLQAQLRPLRNRETIPEEAHSAADSVFGTLDRLERTLSRKGGLERRLGSAGPPPAGSPVPIYIRLNDLYSRLNGYTEAPNQEQRERLRGLSEELDGLLTRLKRLTEEDVPNLHRLMR